MQPLAKILDDNRDGILAGWLTLVRDAAGPLYAEQSISELYHTGAEGFDGLVELLRTGNDQPLHRYVNKIVHKRSVQGFQLAEVQRAYTSMREVIWPYLLANYFDRDSLAKAIAALDLAMNHAVLEFSLTYETQVTTRFRQLAIPDPLTGLYNRRYLDLMLGNELARLSRGPHALSLLFIDLDNFKRFNDTHGHLNGDRALVLLADIMRTHLREADVVTRYGGEEFVVVLPDTGAQEAFTVAERLRGMVAQAPFPGSHGPEQLTISIGVATTTQRLGLKAFLHAADEAAYRAKRTGRNRVCVARLPTAKSA